MRSLRLILSCWMPLLAVRAGEDQGWSEVQAARGAHIPLTLSVPGTTSGEEVRLVGVRQSVPSESQAVQRVILVELDQAGPIGAPAPASLPSVQALAGALHPDEGDRITLDSQGIAGSLIEARNPWEERRNSPKSLAESRFFFGGYIAGGGAGPVALVNGRIIRQGDAIGEFRVARILSHQLFLERKGVFLEIPPGRLTVVTTVGN
jgi:hypothetical protein